MGAVVADVFADSAEDRTHWKSACKPRVGERPRHYDEIGGIVGVFCM